MSWSCRFLIPPAIKDGNQDDETLTILAEINPVARAKIDLVFQNTRADAFDVGAVPALNPGEGYRHLGSSHGIQPLEPQGKAFLTVLVNVAAKLKHLG